MINSLDRYIKSLVGFLSLRDLETEEHTFRVAVIAVDFAHRLNVPEKDLIHVHHGALLHDIGKIGIPDAILHKKGPLTSEEEAIMRMHTNYAYELLRHLPIMEKTLDIPYCHHEKWDGTGYPRGLKGDQIPFLARLFAVVDVWDALLSKRPYRMEWKKDQAVDYIHDQAGKQFDPEIVEGFTQYQSIFDTLEDFPVHKQNWDWVDQLRQ